MICKYREIINFVFCLRVTRCISPRANGARHLAISQIAGRARGPQRHEKPRLSSVEMTKRSKDETTTQCSSPWNLSAAGAEAGAPNDIGVRSWGEPDAPGC